MIQPNYCTEILVITKSNNHSYYMHVRDEFQRLPVL